MFDTIQSETIVIRQVWYWYVCFHCGQASPRETSPESARHMANQAGVFNSRGFWFCDHCADFIPEKESKI